MSQQIHPEQVILSIPHGRIGAGVYVGGQPSRSDFAALKEAGIDTIINMRMGGELDYDEGPLVEELGMRYVSIPVAGPIGMTIENADLLDTALVDGEQVLVHCASANRVGGLFAIRAFKAGGISVDKAITLGKQHGLASLEPRIRQVLAASQSE